MLSLNYICIKIKDGRCCFYLAERNLRFFQKHYYNSIIGCARKNTYSSSEAISGCYWATEEYNKNERILMKIIFEYCEKGNAKYNEDVIEANENMACVIDGATDVFRDEHNNMDRMVQDYVNLLIKNIFLCYDEEKNLYDILMRAIGKVYSYFDNIYYFEKYREFELPTFSIACIKQCVNGFEYLVLGDCSIEYTGKGKNKIIRDERVKEFSKHNRSEMKRLKIDPRKDPEAMQVYKNTRMKANSFDGYPIGSVSGVGLKNAIRGMINKESVDSILLYSDGFEDYFTARNINVSFFDEKQKIQEVIDSSMDFYNNNEQYSKQLRPKQIDDRSILLIKTKA